MLDQYLRQQSAFLTQARPNITHNNKNKNGCMQKSIENSNNSIQNDLTSLKTSIIELIRQFQNKDNFQQVKQLLVETFDMVDGLYIKRNIFKVKQIIQNQNCSLKLKRLLNELRIIKKNINRRNIASLVSKQADKINSSQAKRKTYKHQKPQPAFQDKCHQNKLIYHQNSFQSHFQSKNSFYKTLPNQDRQKKQLKTKIKQQISYRQRLQKIKSQNQKHIKNRTQLIHKKVSKLKQINKKVHEVYRKNKNLIKQQSSKYKYQILFDPQQLQINRQKRGKTMQLKSKNYSLQQLQQPFANKINFKNPFQDNDQEFKINKNNYQQENKLYTKNDIITFKSLKEIFGQTQKKFKQNQYKKQNKQNSLYDKNLYKKNKNVNFQKQIKYHQQQSKQTSFEYRKNNIIQKKHDLQQQRNKKIISQLIKKQQKIKKAIKRKQFFNSLKKKQSRKDSKSNDQFQPQRNPSKQKQKSMFKKVHLTRKQLIDKERKIFMDIENKLQRKQMFLQKRVNKVRYRLDKQNQIRLNHQNSWNEYTSLTQNISINQTMTASPKHPNVQKVIRNQKSPLNHKKVQDKQQKIIKNYQQEKIKQQSKFKIHNKLHNFSLKQLHSKLRDIQSQQHKIDMNRSHFA